jgi:hypothetical protein
MKRRSFIKKVGLTAGGIAAAPWILPSGRLFAATGSRLVDHVVLCMFAGGVRNLEAVHKAEGNLMPGMLPGNEAISPDIASTLSLLPSITGLTLLEQGTLFQEFRFQKGPTGHYHGYNTTITGRYVNSTLNTRGRPEFPTLFELYRKHSAPEKNAMNAWLVTQSSNLYPLLNHSEFPGYGAAYGANQITPNTLFGYNTSQELNDMIDFDPTHEGGIDKVRNFINNNFKLPGVNVSSGIRNSEEDSEVIQQFLSKMYADLQAGLHNNPWGVSMNGDMRNIFYAEEVIKNLKPELLVVDMFGVDTAHRSFTGYCHALYKASWAMNHLWNTIQQTPGMTNNTMMIVVPEIGRNGTGNSLVDENNRNGLDHTSDDAMSRELFCLIAGPPSVVKQNQLITTVAGESIDVIPTIAHALGFYDGAASMLSGQKLMQAFV